jgi:hypothetical protein
MQKRDPSGAMAPHEEQRRSIGAPHSMQKRASAGFSAEQDVHVTMSSARGDDVCCPHGCEYR